MKKLFKVFAISNVFVISLAFILSTKLQLLSNFFTITSLTVSMMDWMTVSSFSILSMMAARISPFAGFVESIQSVFTLTFDLL